MSEEPQRMVNTWDQLTAAVAAKIIPKKYALAISYQAPARHIVSAGVHIWSPFFKTDPKAAWYDHGHATFSDDREAKEWAAARGYTGEWVRNALHDWVPAVVQENFPIKKKAEAMSDSKPLTPGEPVTLLLPDHVVMATVAASTRHGFMVILSSRDAKT